MLCDFDSGGGNPEACNEGPDGVFESPNAAELDNPNNVYQPSPDGWNILAVKRMDPEVAQCLASECS